MVGLCGNIRGQKCCYADLLAVSQAVSFGNVFTNLTALNSTLTFHSGPAQRKVAILKTTQPTRREAG